MKWMTAWITSIMRIPTPIQLHRSQDLVRRFDKCCDAVFWNPISRSKETDFDWLMLKATTPNRARYEQVQRAAERRHMQAVNIQILWILLGMHEIWSSIELKAALEAEREELFLSNYLDRYINKSHSVLNLEHLQNNQPNSILTNCFDRSKPYPDEFKRAIPTVKSKFSESEFRSLTHSNQLHDHNPPPLLLLLSQCHHFVGLFMRPRFSTSLHQDPLCEINIEANCWLVIIHEWIWTFELFMRPCQGSGPPPPYGWERFSSYFLIQPGRS